jgi:hypothetical protein
LSQSNKHQKIFTIHIIETDDGHVRVVSDWSGQGDMVLSLGVEILDKLAAIQPYTEGYLGFAPAMMTNAEH